MGGRRFKDFAVLFVANLSKWPAGLVEVKKGFVTVAKAATVEFEQRSFDRPRRDLPSNEEHFSL